MMNTDLFADYCKEGMRFSIPSYVSSSRTTLCDIICTSNTPFALEEPLPPPPKLKPLIATLPQDRPVGVGPIKTTTLWGKFKVEDSKIRKVLELKRDKEIFYEKLHREKEELEAKKNNAATRIQAIFRGFRKRKPTSYVPKKKAKKNLTQFEIQDELCQKAMDLHLKPIDGLNLEWRAKASKRRIKIENAAAFTIQKFFRMIYHRSLAQLVVRRKRIEYVNHKAKVITKAIRYMKTKNFSKRVDLMKRHRSANVIQRNVRRFQAIKRVKELRKKRFTDWKRNEAAIIIQRNLSGKNRDTLRLARLTLISLRSFRKLSQLVEDSILTSYLNEKLDELVKEHLRLLSDKVYQALRTSETIILESEVDFVIETCLVEHVYALLEEENLRNMMERIMLEEQFLMFSEDINQNIRERPESAPEPESLTYENDFEEEKQEPEINFSEVELEVQKTLANDFVSEVLEVVQFKLIPRPKTPSELFVDATFLAAVENVTKSFLVPPVLEEEPQPEEPVQEEEEETQPIPNVISTLGISLKNTGLDSSTGGLNDNESYNFDSTVSNIEPEDSFLSTSLAEEGSSYIEPSTSYTESYVEGTTIEPSVDKSFEESVQPSTSLVSGEPGSESQYESQVDSQEHQQKEEKKEPFEEEKEPEATANLIDKFAEEAERMEEEKSQGVFEESSVHSQESVKTVTAVTKSADSVKIALELISQGKFNEVIKDIDETIVVVDKALTHASKTPTMDPAIKTAKLSIVTNVLALLKARALYSTARYEEARDLLFDVMQGRITLLGQDHYLVGEIYFYIAEWYRSLGFHDEAEAWYLKADGILVEALLVENTNHHNKLAAEEDDEHTLEGDDEGSLGGESSVQSKQQSRKNSEISRTDVIHDFEKNKNVEDDDDRSIGSQSLASLDDQPTNNDGRPGTSEQLFSENNSVSNRSESTAPSRRRKLSQQKNENIQKTNPSLYTVYKLYHRNVIAYTELLRTAGQYYKSFYLLKKIQLSLLQYKESLNLQSFEVKEEFLTNYIKFLVLQGNYTHAIALHQELLDKRRLHYGLYHYKIATSLYSLGKLLLLKSQYHEAIQFIEDSLHLRIQLFPNSLHPSVAKSILLKAEGFLHLGYYELAIQEIVKALNIYKSIYAAFNPFHPSIVDCYQSLYSVYALLGEPKCSFNGLTKLLQLKTINPSQALNVVTKRGQKQRLLLGNNNNSSTAPGAMLIPYTPTFLFNSEFFLPTIHINYQLAVNYLTCGNILQGREILTNLLEKYDLLLQQIKGKNAFIENNSNNNNDVIHSPLDYEMMKIDFLSTDLHSLKIVDLKKFYKKMIKRMNQFFRQDPPPQSVTNGEDQPPSPHHTPNMVTPKILYSFAELSKRRGNYLDAKSLINLSYDMMAEVHGEEHPFIPMILMECADNLRIPGYFQEAIMINGYALKLAYLLFPRNAQIPFLSQDLKNTVFSENEKQNQKRKFLFSQLRDGDNNNNNNRNGLEQLPELIRREIYSLLSTIELNPAYHFPPPPPAAPAADGNNVPAAGPASTPNNSNNNNNNHFQEIPPYCGDYQNFQLKENFYIIQILFHRAYLYRDIHQYQLAELFLLYILDFYLQYSLHNTGIYAMALALLGDVYRIQGKYKLAKGILLKAIKLTKLFYGELSLNYFESLFYYNLLLMDIHAYQDAFNLWILTILPNLENLIGIKHPWYLYARVNYLMTKFILENESIFMSNKYMEDSQSMNSSTNQNASITTHTTKNNEMLANFMQNHVEIKSFLSFWHSSNFAADHPWILRMQYQLADAMYYLDTTLTMNLHQSLNAAGVITSSNPAEVEQAAEEQFADYANEEENASTSFSSSMRRRHRRESNDTRGSSVSRGENGGDDQSVYSQSQNSYSQASDDRSESIANGNYAEYRREVLSVISENDSRSSWSGSQSQSQSASYESSLSYDRRDSRRNSKSRPQEGSRGGSEEEDQYRDDFSQPSYLSGEHLGNYNHSRKNSQAHSQAHSQTPSQVSFAPSQSYTQSYYSPSASQSQSYISNSMSYTPYSSSLEQHSSYLSASLPTSYTHSEALNRKLINVEDSSFGKQQRGGAGGNALLSNPASVSDGRDGSQSRGQGSQLGGSITSQERGSKNYDDGAEADFENSIGESEGFLSPAENNRFSHSLAEPSEITYEGSNQEFDN